MYFTLAIIAVYAMTAYTNNPPVSRLKLANRASVIHGPNAAPRIGHKCLSVFIRIASIERQHRLKPPNR